MFSDFSLRNTPGQNSFNIPSSKEFQMKNEAKSLTTTKYKPTEQTPDMFFKFKCFLRSWFPCGISTSKQQAHLCVLCPCSPSCQGEHSRVSPLSFPAKITELFLSLFRMSHVLQFEDKSRKVKDASMQDSDTFEIYDPRNPVNKRRREESKKLMREKKERRQNESSDNQNQLQVPAVNGL